MTITHTHFYFCSRVRGSEMSVNKITAKQAFIDKFVVAKNRKLIRIVVLCFLCR